MRLIVEAAARTDIDEAAAWYDAQDIGLGGAFLDALHATLRRIGDNPRIFRVNKRPLRAASLKKFPYTIYFTQAEDTVHIIAVLHQRRDPGLLDDRLN